jgi:protein SCO1/2
VRPRAGRAALAAATSPSEEQFTLVDVTERVLEGRTSSRTKRTTRTLPISGKVVTVFFGFTHCPDACPTLACEMSQVLSRAGTRCDKVQVLFVTVDPERDTPAGYEQYVPAFHPVVLGLSGDAKRRRERRRSSRSYYQKQPLKTAATA